MQPAISEFAMKQKKKKKKKKKKSYNNNNNNNKNTQRIKSNDVHWRRLALFNGKSALNPTVVYSTDRSKAVVPVLVLLFVALWFILRGNLSYLVLFCSYIFQSF